MISTYKYKWEQEVTQLIENVIIITYVPVCWDSLRSQTFRGDKCFVGLQNTWIGSLESHFRFSCHLWWAHSYNVQRFLEGARHSHGHLSSPLTSPIVRYRCRHKYINSSHVNIRRRQWMEQLLGYSWRGFQPQEESGETMLFKGSIHCFAASHLFPLKEET